MIPGEEIQKLAEKAVKNTVKKNQDVDECLEVVGKKQESKR